MGEDGWRMGVGFGCKKGSPPSRWEKLDRKASPASRPLLARSESIYLDSEVKLCPPESSYNFGLLVAFGSDSSFWSFTRDFMTS